MVMKLTDYGVRTIKDAPERMEVRQLAFRSLGNVHTKTVRAWPVAD